jgi:hypothetical protein
MFRSTSASIAVSAEVAADRTDIAGRSGHEDRGCHFEMSLSHP